VLVLRTKSREKRMARGGASRLSYEEARIC
jgi:hypothetical protein